VPRAPRAATDLFSIQWDMVSSVSVAADFFTDLRGVLALVPQDAIERTVGLLLETQASGRRVYVIGNGGSAATASHFVCDLVKSTSVSGAERFRAFALTDNIPLLTAWANDSAYERTFAEQVSALVDPGDVVIGVSASGNSPNIIAGLAAAVARGARTVGLLGFDGGAARSKVDIAVHIPCDDYGLVEAVHLAISHAITAAIKEALESRTAPVPDPG
jgi:D-sedoheptulose 7-phosphate isomerase